MSWFAAILLTATVIVLSGALGERTGENEALKQVDGSDKDKTKTDNAILEMQHQADMMLMLEKHDNDMDELSQRLEAKMATLASQLISDMENMSLKYDAHIDLIMELLNQKPFADTQHDRSLVGRRIKHVQASTYDDCLKLCSSTASCVGANVHWPSTGNADMSVTVSCDLFDDIYYMVSDELGSFVAVHKVQYYRHTGEATLYDEAVAGCQDLGMKLITFETRSKVQAVRRWFPRFVHWSRVDGNRVDGEYKWPNGQTIQSGLWKPGEPTNNNDEGCAYIEHGLRMNDFSCYETAPYLCEF